MATSPLMMPRSFLPRATHPARVTVIISSRRKVRKRGLATHGANTEERERERERDIDDGQVNDISGLDLESEAVEASSHYDEVH